jgi:hypothetical protein
MEETDFPFPSINRPKKAENEQINQRLSEVFDSLEGYKDKVKPYIFTNIKLSYDRGDERFILSRIQQYLSSVLLRSLYLRNGVVDAINSRNLVSLFANLKSFVEIPAVLAYFLSLLNRNNLNEEGLLELLKPLVLGNRGGGDLRAGKYEAVNILTMFDKLESFMCEIRVNSSNPADPKIDSIMTEFYSLVCNAAHPNYDAHDVSGIFEPDKDWWRGLYPNEFKKRIVEDSAWYTPPLATTIITIEVLTQRIMAHDIVKNFEKLNSSLYFNL